MKRNNGVADKCVVSCPIIARSIRTRSREEKWFYKMRIRKIDKADCLEAWGRPTGMSDDGCGQPASIEGSASHSNQFTEATEGHARISYHSFSFWISEMISKRLSIFNPSISGRFAWNSWHSIWMSSELKISQLLKIILLYIMWRREDRIG